jgi:plastocyanin
VTLRYGPIHVGPYAVKYGTAPVQAPEMDGFITRMYARMVDKQGNAVPLSRMMLHHIAFLDLGGPGRPRIDETYCKGKVGRRFYGTGEEDQAMVLPPGYGYRIRKDDFWSANSMVMNHGPQDDEAYLEYTMTIDDSPDLVPVRPHWIGVVPCSGDPIFDVPGGGKPGSVHRESATWTVPSNGRIIAAGGHIHGGSYGLALRQPSCDNRLLVASRPVYGQPDHPSYHVLPVLHEPGPIGASWTMTKMGIGLSKGDKLRLTAFYDAENMHVRAMGIMHVYMAPRVRNVHPSPCPPLPPDRTEGQQKAFAARLLPPAVRVPLTGIGRDGRARTIERPSGRHVTLARPSRLRIDIKGQRLSPSNLTVPAGTTLQWRFDDQIRHDVTVADGPFGFSSQPLSRGLSFSRKLTRPGIYKLFCSLHPVAMTQRVTVVGSK